MLAIAKRCGRSLEVDIRGRERRVRLRELLAAEDILVGHDAGSLRLVHEQRGRRAVGRTHLLFDEVRTGAREHHGENAEKRPAPRKRQGVSKRHSGERPAWEPDGALRSDCGRQLRRLTILQHDIVRLFLMCFLPLLHPLLKC